MAAELVKLVDAGTIRLIDVLVLAKDENGDIEAIELEDLEELGELARFEADLAELLAEEDVVNLAAAMDPRERRRGSARLREHLGRAVRGCGFVGRAGNSSPMGGSPSKRSSPRSRPMRNSKR